MVFDWKKSYSSNAESYCIYRYQNIPYSIVYIERYRVCMYRRISADPNTPNICWIIVQVQNGKTLEKLFLKGSLPSSQSSTLCISGLNDYIQYHQLPCSHGSTLWSVTTGHEGCFNDYTRTAPQPFFSAQLEARGCASRKSSAHATARSTYSKAGPT